MNAYYYAFLPMLLGIAFVSAGIKTTFGHLAEHPHQGPALALAGGVALFLAGDAAFRTALGLRPVRYRAATAPLALATAAPGVRMPVYGELLLLLAVLAVMLVVEARHCTAAAPDAEPSPPVRPDTGRPEAGPTGS